MKTAKCTGKVQTVVGLIEPEDLGITLPHEHLLIDQTVGFIEPKETSARLLAHQPVSLENLSWLRYHPYENFDNMQLLDEQEAIDEAMLYQRAKGKTIVDVTITGIGRNPKALARISQATGLNIVMGSGYYVEGSYSKEMMDAKTEEEITEEIVKDITVGVDDTGIRSGVIGELGCSWPLHDNERKVLRAAAQAQQRTGASISVHPGRNRKAPFEVMEILGEAGADLNRIIMCHIDSRLRDHSERIELLKTGCVAEYDLWGWEGHFPSYLTAEGFLDLPNDTQRIYEVRQLIEAGYIAQIFMSHDICTKNRLCRYGGWGYSHILNYVVPMMLQRGMTQEQINTMMVENPKRLLPFV